MEKEKTMAETKDARDVSKTEKEKRVGCLYQESHPR
jgi:hypothetical protein